VYDTDQVFLGKKPKITASQLVSHVSYNVQGSVGFPEVSGKFPADSESSRHSWPSQVDYISIRSAMKGVTILTLPRAGS
jgi:hypothetical protein